MGSVFVPDGVAKNENEREKRSKRLLTLEKIQRVDVCATDKDGLVKHLEGDLVRVQDERCRVVENGR